MVLQPSETPVRRTVTLRVSAELLRRTEEDGESLRGPNDRETNAVQTLGDRVNETDEMQQENEVRRRSVCKENKAPGEDVRRNLRTQNARSEPKRARTRTRTGSGLRCEGEVQVCRPEVRVALIRKTRTQTSIQTDPGPAETQRDRRTQTRTTEASSQVRIRSRSRSPAGLVTETRRRRRVHPSVFRGRGQLQLSITAGAGRLSVHIHRARGLRSCDSYVKLAVTSDLSIRMKTPTVLNNRNPEYKHKFTL
ncbi:uncharacterized protein LOC121964129, partial [Plectropomus leopardus]|uniref:uncharacterized protein LOC121964129 n=1 Tax=Plectropomus leopardus TaxID=160734 RepID=UPI001C4B75C8